MTDLFKRFIDENDTKHRRLTDSLKKRYENPVAAAESLYGEQYKVVVILDQHSLINAIGNFQRADSVSITIDTYPLNSVQRVNEHFAEHSIGGTSYTMESQLTSVSIRLSEGQSIDFNHIRDYSEEQRKEFDHFMCELKSALSKLHRKPRWLFYFSHLIG